eukprot:m.118617 g.118617  ORF g.118617 m.118617 type:complete len:881 (+) comp14281_c0_seq6:181-2823(+)
MGKSSTKKDSGKKKRKKKSKLETEDVVFVDLHKLDHIDPRYLNGCPKARVSLIVQDPNEGWTILASKLSEFSTVTREMKSGFLFEDKLVLNCGARRLNTFKEQLIVIDIIDSPRQGTSELGRTLCWAFLRFKEDSLAWVADRKIRLQLIRSKAVRNRSAPSNSFVSWLPCIKNPEENPSLQESSTATLSSSQERLAHNIRERFDSNKQRFPSTIFVTVSSTTTTHNLEKKNANNSHMPTSEDLITENQSVHSVNSPLWQRVEGTQCSIPSGQQFLSTPSQEGFLSLKFSHNGLWLCAGANGSQMSFPLQIYKIQDSRTKTLGEHALKHSLYGHSNLVYDIDWSADDNLIVSASSDGTARIWNANTFSNMPMKILTHPCFVYCARFRPLSNDGVVATGAYDGIVRIWDIMGESHSGNILQELTSELLVPINTICFRGDSTLLFDGDASGQVHVWESSEQNDFEFTLSNSQPESQSGLEKEAITHIELHPSEQRLLVHSESHIRMLDLRSMVYMRSFRGALIKGPCAKSCLSACGSYVFAGSDRGTCVVWDSDSAKVVKKYHDLGPLNKVRCVTFHPKDNILALSSFGTNQSILILRATDEADKDIASPSNLNHLATLEKRNRMIESTLENSKTLLQESRKTLGTLRIDHGPTSMPSPDRHLQRAKIRDSVLSSRPDSTARDLKAELVRHLESPGPASDAASQQRHSILSMSNQSEAPLEEPYQALYPYEAQRSDELTFAAGDIIMINTSKTDKKWWKGRLSHDPSLRGMVPSNYVEAIAKIPQESTQLSTSDFDLIQAVEKKLSSPQVESLQDDSVSKVAKDGLENPKYEHSNADSSVNSTVRFRKEPENAIDKARRALIKTRRERIARLGLDARDRNSFQ